LVKKKDRKYQMCVDLRELIKRLMKEHYTIHHIDDLLDKLRGQVFFTKLDLKNAYFHVRVSEQSSKYLSFLTFLVQYECVRLPFGYCNSPSAFMRFIEIVFKDLIRIEKLLVYLDDLLIVTETNEENVEIIKLTLRACNKNLLELRKDKCFFLQSKITYFDYMVDKDGVRPDLAYVAAVTQFSIHKSIARVHSFIRLVSYLRRFIENFSILEASLYALLKKGDQFKFREKELQVFELLKCKLVQLLILTLYSPSAETKSVL
jgi:hypothetical protein